MWGRPAPERECERRGAGTRAEPATPRARGLHGGRGGGADLLSPPPQRQPRRLDQRFGPLPAQGTAGGSDAGDGKGAGVTPTRPRAPGASPSGPSRPRPRPSARLPRVPQLVPVRPMNWCVRGFHTNSFHSSTTCPQLFFSFRMTILAAGAEDRAGRGGYGKAGVRCAVAPLPRTGSEGDPLPICSCCEFRGARPRAAGCWQRGVRCIDPRPPNCDKKGDCQSGGG